MEEVIVEIPTSKNIIGNYYIWIRKGIFDVAGNTTKESICSSVYVNVDSILITARVSIKRNNVTNESFARDGDDIILTVDTNKELVTNPIISIGDGNEMVIATISNISSKKYEGRITITNEIAEGKLKILITNLRDKLGNEGEPITETIGSVEIDRTSPILIYNNK